METDWVGILREFGFPTLGAIALAFAIWTGLKWLKLKFDKMFDILTTVKENTPEVRLDTVEDFTHLSMDIEKILYVILTHFRCAYVRYWMFHNGTYSIGGSQRIPFLHMGLLAEVMDFSRGLKGMTAEFAQFPLSTIVRLTEYLMSHSLMIYGPLNEHDLNPEEISISDNAITNRMIEVGCTWQYFVPVRDNRGSIVGLLEADFTNKDDKAPDDADPKLTREDQLKLKIYGPQIGILVDRYGIKHQKVNTQNPIEVTQPIGVRKEKR